MIVADKIVLPSDPWHDHAISEDDLQEERDCPICYCDFEVGDTVAMLNCGHIILWFDKNVSSPTCPICRKDMFENISNQNQSIISDEIRTTDNNIVICPSNEDTNSNDLHYLNQPRNNSNKRETNSCCCILI